MDFENNSIPNFFDWFVPAVLIVFPSVIALFAFLGWLVGFLVSSARRGPTEGFYSVAKVIASGTVDLANTTVRRTAAMAMLAIQEAIRRKVLIVFALFVVIMLFAGWFLDSKSDNPAKLYLSFVLTASNYLVIVLALFLSAFSLPTDMKNKTIYTIVTKPVRASEIVMGRIVGFSLIGTAILAAMCAVSYLFVVRGLSHRHGTEANLETVQNADGSTTLKGETTLDSHHRHTFEIDADGVGETGVSAGHKHYVQRTGTGPDAKIDVGPPVEMLQARNPIYGELSYLDRAGKPSQSGVNVGHEWLYRSYVEGGTLSTAIWKFAGVEAAQFPDGLTIEMNLRAFRTHKGNIERGVRGEFFLVNPDSNAQFKRSEPIPFVVREFVIDRRTLPIEIEASDKDGKVSNVNLFESLSHNGQIEVHVRCTDPGQYLGMARPDLFILDQEGSFFTNFIKGFIGIWLQMVLVTTFGVMFSTFLSGPVAMMATLSSIVIGFFGDFIRKVTLGTIIPDSLDAVQGGGPIESFIRIVLQMNLQADIEFNTYLVWIIKKIDFVFMQAVQIFTYVLPNFHDFSTAAYVAHGFNISPGLMGIMLLKTSAYFVVVSLVGFFFLKTREIAST